MKMQLDVLNFVCDSSGFYNIITQYLIHVFCFCIKIKFRFNFTVI